MALFVLALVLLFGGYFMTLHPEFFYRMRWFPLFQRHMVPKLITVIIVIEGWITVGIGILILIALLFA